MGFEEPEGHKQTIEASLFRDQLGSVFHYSLVCREKYDVFEVDCGR